MGIIVSLMLLTNCKKEDKKEGPLFPVDSLRDIENNYYMTVRIGNQWWMAENLRTNTYNDSTAIPLVTINSIWAGLKTGACCWYNNDANYKNDFGALYNFFAVATAKLCPKNWTIPTTEDWKALGEYLGGLRGAGAKLKEAGFLHWQKPNYGATNFTGFRGLPGGMRFYNNGGFTNMNQIGFFWSSSQSVDGVGDFFELGYSDPGLDFSTGGGYTAGFSVRCIKKSN